MLVPTAEYEFCTGPPACWLINNNGCFWYLIDETKNQDEVEWEIFYHNGSKFEYSAGGTNTDGNNSNYSVYSDPKGNGRRSFASSQAQPVIGRPSYI